MPKIPMYQQQTNTPGVSAPSKVGRVDVSSGLANFGKAVGEVGGALGQVYTNKATDASRLAASKAETEALLKLSEAQQLANQAVNSGDTSAYDDFADQAVAALGTQLESNSKDLNPLAKRLFDQRAVEIQGRIQLTAQKMQIGGSADVAVAAYKQSSQEDANAAYHIRDDATFFSKLGTIVGDIQSDSRMSDPRINKTAIMSATDRAGESYLRKFIDEGAHQTVLNKLDSGDFDGVITQSTMLSLRNAAESGVSQVVNGSLVAARDALNKADATVSQGGITSENLEAIRANLTAMQSRGDLSQSANETIGVLLAKADKIESNQDFSTAFTRIPLTDQRDTLAEMERMFKTGETDDKFLDQYRLAASIHTYATDMLAKKPYEYASRIGKIIDPMPIYDPETIADDLVLFRQQAAMIEADLGAANTIVLPTAYANGVLSLYKQSTPEQKAAIMSNLSEHLQPTEIPRVANQLAGDDNVFASALSMSRYDYRQSADLVHGATIEIKGSVDTKIREAFNSHISNAVGSPRYQENLRESVAALYAKRVHDMGLDPQGYYPEVFEHAFKRHVGERIDTKLSFMDGEEAYTLTFRKESGELATNDEFQTVIYEATNEDLLLAGLSTMHDKQGTILPANDMLRRSRLVIVGENQYKLVTSTGVVANEQNEDYILDMKKLHPIVMAKKNRVNASEFGKRKIDSIEARRMRLSNPTGAN